MMSRLAYLLGFILIFNVYTNIPFLGQARYSDLLSFILNLIIIYFSLRRKFVSSYILPLIILGLILPSYWIISSIISHNAGDLNLSLRWPLYIGYAFSIKMIFDDHELRIKFLKGGIMGSLGLLLVLIAQYYGYFEITQSLGFANQIFADGSRAGVVSSQGSLRFPGSFGHPNSTMAVISLVFPMGIYLYKERKNIIFIILPLIIIGISYLITESRSSVYCVMMIGFLWYLTSNIKNIRKVILFSICMIIFYILFNYYGDFIQSQRIGDASSLSESGADRIYTFNQFINISLENFFGIGISYKDGMVFTSNGNSAATHNAFLQLSLLGGIPMALMSIVFYLISLFKLRKNHEFPFYILLQSFMLMFFEEHYNNPVFIIINLVSSTYITSLNAVKQLRKGEK